MKRSPAVQSFDAFTAWCMCVMDSPVLRVNPCCPGNAGGSMLARDGEQDRHTGTTGLGESIISPLQAVLRIVCGGTKIKAMYFKDFNGKLKPNKMKMASDMIET